MPIFNVYIDTRDFVGESDEYEAWCQSGMPEGMTSRGLQDGKEAGYELWTVESDSTDEAKSLSEAEINRAITRIFADSDTAPWPLVAKVEPQ